MAAERLEQIKARYNDALECRVMPQNIIDTYLRDIPDLLAALEQAQADLLTAKAARDLYKHLYEDHSEGAAKTERANVRYWKAQAEQAQERERVLVETIRSLTTCGERWILRSLGWPTKN